MELASKENEEIVSKIYGEVLGEIGKPGRAPDSVELSLLCDVESFQQEICLLYTSPSPRDLSTSRMPSSA